MTTIASTLPDTWPPAAAGPGLLSRAALFMFAPLAVLGIFLPLAEIGGVNLFGFRLLVLAAALLPIVADPRLAWLKNPPVLYFAALGVVWIGWGALSVFWALNSQAAVVDFLGAVFGFLVALALVNLRADSPSGLKWLLRGWIAGALIAAGIAAWELTTGNHLPSGWVESKPPHITRFIAVATFYNPNNYGAFLLLLVPLILYRRELAGGRTSRALLLLLLLLTFALAVLTTSKVAVIGIILLLVVYIIGRMRNKLLAAGLLSLGAAAFVAALGLLADDVPLLAEFQTLSEQGVALEGSNLMRLNLSLAGLSFVAETFGLGIGGGNFSLYLRSGYTTFWTGDLIDPHNWWIEILSQYGIIVFALFVGFLAYMFFAAKRLARHVDSNLGRILRLSIVAYGLAGLANSSYMMQSTNWLFLATLLVMFSQLRGAALSASEAGGGRPATPKPAGPPA